MMTIRARVKLLLYLWMGAYESLEEAFVHASSQSLSTDYQRGQLVIIPHQEKGFRLGREGE